MVKKKTNSAKTAKKKESTSDSFQKEDVKVHTGLPPQVEGQLRCFVRLSVSQIMWLTPVVPQETHVRVKWWGETGDGALFRPVDMKKGNKGPTKTVARYPVRSGPRQFAAYLNDMDTLVLEVLSGPLQVQVGFAEVAGMGGLAPNRPINGFYPVFSPNNDKIAEVQVSLILESVMESYDSTGDSIPTTDISMDAHLMQESQMYPQRRQPIPHSTMPTKPQDDPFISPTSQQNGDARIMNGHATDLRQQLNYSFLDNSHIVNHHQQHQHYQPHNPGRTVSVTTNGDVVTTEYDNPNVSFRSKSSERPRSPNRSGLPQRSREKQINGHHGHMTNHMTKKGNSPPRSPHRRNFSQPLHEGDISQNAGNSSSNPGTDNGDLLSILLQRGDKLRKQMIISSVDDSLKDKEVKETDGATGGLDKDDLDFSRGSTGSFLKEILKAEKQYKQTDVDGSYLGEKAVDLVVGDEIITDYQMLQLLGGSPKSSFSGDMDVYSDPGDPIHSQSLIQDLFYKNMDSEVSGLSELSGDEEIIKKSEMTTKKRIASPSPSLDDPDNARPPSRRSSISSITLPLPEPEREEKPKKNPEKKARTPRTPKRKSRLKTKRKGSKKRKRSRSAASGSDFSDSENMSTSRSEMSQVSFDMPPSDIDEPEEEECYRKKKSVDGLSVERLTLLGRVHVARVNIESLKLVGQDVNTTPSKKKSKPVTVGRPPKPSPKAKKPVTYFIEYQFPVVATSRDKHAPNAMATEVMRVASKNVKDGVVTFNHRSVFPIMFDGSAVDKWWKSALVFKLYSRSAGQKVPTQIGSCGVPLKSILKSDLLQLDKTLEIRENMVSVSANSSVRSIESEGLFGHLKVSLELGSDSRDFSSALAKTKMAEMSGRAKIVPLPKPPPPASKPPIAPPQSSAIMNQDPVLHMKQVQRETEVQMSEDLRSDINRLVPESVRLSQQTNYNQGMMQIPLQYGSHQLPEVLTLHTLLLIPEGRNITYKGMPSLSALAKGHGAPSQPTSLTTSDLPSKDIGKRNTYLVCRMFWCDDAVHSNVCWGNHDPTFNFIQIAPVLVSDSLLERMRNNFMIVEVWEKKTTAENDKLIGIVKLSLHQFYMSFRDRKITSALLRSQYPVISVDNYLPVVDPLSGTQYGQIKVLLAMGSAEQVSCLQRLKLEDVGIVPERPNHHLEKGISGQDSTNTSMIHGAGTTVEHIFEIVIEDIRGLSMFEKMMWGEADCFVQYHFPTQSQAEYPGAPNLKRATPTVKSYRSATTLCIPDPTFNEVTRHRFSLPQGTPVQRELLNAISGTGGGGGGIPFEVWCRFYHPNVRDQCIAKSSLPLAKLCAMVTMQKRGEPSVQSFALNLSHVGEDTSTVDPEYEAKMKECGLLDITVHYKTQMVRIDATNAAHKNLGNSQVCVSLSIVRACGLKTAAEAVAHLDTGMEYPAEVGVNSYVKVRMSFIGREDERITRTVARSFSPEFSHSMDFPLSLIWTEPDTEALSLAEILEGGTVTMEIWHQVPGLAPDMDRQLLQMAENETKGRQLIGKTCDVLLGTTTLPLSQLLTHRTGINGWYPVMGNPFSQSLDSSGNHGNRIEGVVGGLEVCVKFAHHNDRDKVIDAGRGVGWSPVNLQVEDEDDWMSDDESTDRFYTVQVHIEQANFPIQSALIAGQTALDRSTRCYIRYKLYDKGAVVSKVVKLADTDDYLTSELGHRHKFQIPASSPFRWYLREEHVEVQVWVSYGYVQGKNGRPQHRDKLIGTAYINMEALTDQRRKQHRISENFPLFKPGSAKLGGAYIKAQITLKPEFGVPRQDEEVLLTDGEADLDPDYDPEDSFHRVLGQRSPTKSKLNQSRLNTVEESVVPAFAVMISVDRAMHLPHISDKTRSGEQLPNPYVTYQTAESDVPTSTSICPRADNPIWDHQHETKLSTELLFQENKNLVFKVWHSSGGRVPDKSVDRVLGFVSVDLTPLTSGLQQICGWYNIVDFNGQCRGQIKVNVIPQECVSQYNTAGSTPSQPCSLPIGVGSSIHEPPAWIMDQPMSLPVNTKPFTSNLPQFDVHYESVRQHHEQLQQQLAQNIQDFLEQQQRNLESEPPTAGNSGNIVNNIVQSELSLHWVPNIPESRFEDSNASSRSFLFTSLRKQMQDLDDVTNRLKQKLIPSTHMNIQSDQEIPVTCQSGHATLTSTRSGLSSLSSIHLLQSQRESSRTQDTHESELLLTGSNRDESSQGVDSGAFSVTHSSEKYQYNEPLDSQRSASDKLDTFRLGTPRELHKFTEVDSTPRDHSNSDTGIHVAYTPRDDDITPVSTGAFQFANTPREIVSPATSPRNNGLSSVPSSNPTSLGFQYHTDSAPHSQQNSWKVYSANGSKILPSQSDECGSKEQKDMSIIHENVEYEGSDGEGDEKYYHRYRDILDEQQKNDDSSDGESENEEGEIIMPRTLNDVSGKFGGIPGQSGIIHNVAGSPREFPGRMTESPREFHQSDNTMPFDILGTDARSRSNTGSKSNSGSRKTGSEEDVSDVEELPCSDPSKDRQGIVGNFYQEKDSWLTDGDNEKSGYDHSLEPDSRTEIQHFQQETSENSKDFLEKDSWFSEDEGQRSQFESSLDASSRSQGDKVGAKGRLWSGNMRLDTISSAGSKENDSFYQQRGEEEKDLLSHVELDSVTSGTNTQKMDSVSTSRELSASQVYRNYREEPLEELDEDVPKTVRESYEKVVHELDEFFSNSNVNDKEDDLNSTLDTPRSGQSGNVSFEQIYNSNLQQMPTSSENVEVHDINYSDNEHDSEGGAVSERRKERKSPCEEEGPINSEMPNFFPPVQHLEQSMKALNLATSNYAEPQLADLQEEEDEEITVGKAEAAAEMSRKLQASKPKGARPSTKGRSLPTAEEAKRIAKIFSTKLS
ncbi:hypothetical protein FSP39_025242 [Pinctada imbricata]|uniref:C2 domain-containing protein n=1 Tax=Pinctada imbricata TaxID=66713 RepID=A0AA88Y8X4_PINIB|nr:hypothetical protein FSP39_025242 [Pinctada imbricata]